MCVKRIIFDFMAKASDYLKSLKMMQTRTREGKETQYKAHVLETINKTPVLGYLVNMQNLLRICATYVEGQNDRIDLTHSIQRMKFLRTYAMSQDHLELFSGKIRSKNGHNDNPNVVQFKGAYRKLLANVHIKPPENSNCMILNTYDSDQVTFDSPDLPTSNVFVVS